MYNIETKLCQIKSQKYVKFIYVIGLIISVYIVILQYGIKILLII